MVFSFYCSSKVGLNCQYFVSSCRIGDGNTDFFLKKMTVEKTATRFDRGS